METRAAVAHKAGAPLTIETVTLDGPQAGEVLVEIRATGICHTDAFTLSGEDPEGLFPGQGQADITDPAEDEPQEDQVVIGRKRMWLRERGEDEEGGYGSFDEHAVGRTALLFGGEKQDQENQGGDQNQKIGHSYKRCSRPCKA